MTYQHSVSKKRNKFRFLILAVLLVTACGGDPVTSAPSVAAVPTVAPTVASLAPTSAPCEPAALAGLDAMQPLVEQYAVALVGEPEAMADVAFRAGQVAAEVLPSVRNDPRLTDYETALETLRDAAGSATPEDSLALIEALGAIVELAPSVREACR